MKKNKARYLLILLAIAGCENKSLDSQTYSLNSKIDGQAPKIVEDKNVESAFDKGRRQHEEAMAELSKISQRMKEESARLNKQTEELKSQGFTASEVNSDEWTYEEISDRMQGGKARYASIRSSNSLLFTAPFGGETKAELQIRQRPSDGLNILFSVPKGLIVCSPNCVVKVKFDDRAPIKFKAVQPTDFSHKAIFIDSEAKFVKELKKSNIVLIEVTYYGAGAQIAEFKAANFNWK